MPPITQLSAQGGMFHTFQGVAPRKQPAGPRPKTTPTPGTKRVTTPHACSECKRRKIRCDGKQPCGQCLSSRSRLPKKCVYDKHRQRVVPSRKVLESLSESLEEYRTITKRLFPDHNVKDLLLLSRQQLLLLVSQQPTTAQPALHVSPSINTESSIPHDASNMEQIPIQSSEWDEERRYHEPIPSEADDVNSLALHVDRQTSYMGASSVKAALIVMLKVQPLLKSVLSGPFSQDSHLAGSMPDHTRASPKRPQKISWSWKGQTLVDAYFKRTHIFIPMLDEPKFRADYLEGHRTDSPWIALLNMVFAMGSIAALKSDDYSHIHYYNRAMEHLPIDVLGSSHMESVQALAIAGGYYLHYINKPNMANAILGAAIRMASALGLHRETPPQGDASPVEMEMRRRTWWSLFCLDTWATTTLGRPSFGRWGPAINIQPPEFGILQNNDSAQHAGVFPLVENTAFCKIATQIQDLLAVSPLLNPTDRCNLDQQLLTWYNELPWLLRTTDSCSEPLCLARCIMKWRYHNIRLLLYRPMLLSLASSNAEVTTIADQDALAAETCLQVSKETIDSIGSEWSRNQMSGWNAAWFLYQAVMVPLICLFWQPNSPAAHDWRLQVQSVLDLLQAMEEWSLSARRSREVVWKMYEAALKSKEMHQSSVSSGLIPSDMHTFIPGAKENFAITVDDFDAEDLTIVGLFDQYNLWNTDLLLSQPAPLDQTSTSLPNFTSVESALTADLMNIELDDAGLNAYN